MAKNNIELSIGSTFDSEGFDRLNNSLKASAGKVRNVTSAVGGLMSELGTMDGTVGKLTKTAGGLLGGFLSMGVWGAVIGAASALVGWITKIFEEEKKAADELDRANNAWKTAEGRAQGRANRLAADRERIKLIEERSRKDKLAREEELRQMDKRTQLEKEYDQHLMKTAALKDKLAGMTNEHMAVTAAERQLAFAMKWGGQMERDEAQLQLDLAKKAEADAIEAMAQKIREEVAAKENAKAEKKRREAALSEKEKKEKEREETQAVGDRKKAEIDKKLLAAKEQAAVLEANAARARGGKTFGEWQRGERELANDERRRNWRQAKVIENAEREQTAMQSRLFDRNGRLRGSANVKDVERFRKLSEFILNQDPKNNPMLKTVEDLEAEKLDVIKGTKLELERINLEIKGLAS